MVKDWIKLQKELYSQVKKELSGLTTQKSRSFALYEKRFQRDLHAARQCSWKDFLGLQRQSDFFLIGDFHSFHQSQKQLLRLLEDKDVRKPASLGLEALPPDLEPLVQRSTSSKKMKLLKEGLQLEERWGSSWEIYEKIVLSAQRQGIRIFSLGGKQPQLQRRDKEASRRATQHRGPVWLFMGEYHCARPHLPAELKKLSPSARILSLQQNDDRLSLKSLAQMEVKSSLLFRAPKKKEGVDLICLIHTLPWIKWQSDLNFKHQREEGGAEIDAYDQIQWSLRTLIEFFKDRRYPATELRSDVLDFSVISSSDEDFVSSLRRLPKSLKPYVLEQLELRKVAVLGDKRRIYLSELSVNSCAHAASLLLFYSWQGKQQTTSFNFYQNTLEESLTFFLSKVLNHRRKSKTWEELRVKLMEEGHRRKLKTLLRSREFYVWAFDSKAASAKLGPFEREASLVLGRRIADQCFEGFLAGEISKQRLTRHLTSKENHYLRLLELYSCSQDFSY